MMGLVPLKETEGAYFPPFLSFSSAMRGYNKKAVVYKAGREPWICQGLDFEFLSLQNNEKLMFAV